MFLLAAAVLPPLSGNFLPAWNLEGMAAEKGKISKITEHYREGDVVYFFDRNGRKILQTYPDKETRQKIEHRFFYNSEGKLEKIDCSADGSLVYFEKATYHDGLLRELVHYDSRGREVFWTTMMNYDDKTAKLKSFGIQQPDGRVDYFYDRNSKGEVVYIRAFVRNKLGSAARYIFNSAGLITEVHSFDVNMKNAGIILNQWQLDKHGNWIEKKSFFRKNAAAKPRLVAVVKRSIEYVK